MNRLGLTFVLTASAIHAFPALAADLPSMKSPPLAPPPVLATDWTGIYVGVNGGTSWGLSRHDEIVPPAVTTGDFHMSGGMGGGTLGANYQTGMFVLGVEGDGDWGGIRGSTNCPNSTFTCGTKSSYLATARGRVGFAWDRLLVYGTGGAAWGDIKQNFFPPFGGVNGASSGRTGWAVGGGMEIALWQNWSAKLELIHADLGTFTCGYSCVGVPGQIINVRFNENVVRAGINYRFNWGAPWAPIVRAAY